MDQPVKILHAEDEAVAAELIEHELRRAGFDFTILLVSNRSALEEALGTFTPDLILSDFNIQSDLDGFLVLELARQHTPGTPFILVTGTIGEESAVDVMRAGATDYVLKDRIERLGPVVKRALAEAQDRRAKLAMEQALRQSEARFRLFMQHLPGRASIKDAAGRYTYVNETGAAALGLTPGEVVGRPIDEVWVGDRAKELRAAHDAVLATEASVTRVVQTGDKDDAKWWLLTQFPIPVEGGIDVGLVGLDITQQKSQEERIARLSRVQAMLSGINTAIIHAHEEQKLFEEACRMAVEHGRFGIVWIGRFDPAAMVVTPVATGGLTDSDFLKSTPLSIGADTSQSKGNIARAIRDKAPSYVNDIKANAGAGGERRQEAIRRGYGSVIALPLTVDGEVVAAFSLFAREPHFFDAAEVALLTELTANISFALGNMARQRKIEKLSRIRTVSGEINAAIVRVREPEALLREACRIVVEHGRFEFVWTGLIDQDRQLIQPVAWAGLSDEASAALTWDIAANPRTTLAEVMRTRRPAVRDDLSGAWVAWAPCTQKP